MRSKILSRRILIGVVLMGFLFSLVFIIYFTEQNYNLFTDGQIRGNLMASIENVVVLPEPEQVNSGLPIRLKIPKISVDALIEYVGLTSDGAMDAPKERANTAWFNLGPRPGENGSAVIAGHYGWKNGKASVFDNLYKLRKGDRIYVEDDRGNIISFVVRESRRYDPQADASAVFGSNDGKVHLNLVTCEGEWDKVSKSYSKRLVVFTDKVVE